MFFTAEKRCDSPSKHVGDRYGNAGGAWHDKLQCCLRLRRVGEHSEVQIRIARHLHELFGNACRRGADIGGAYMNAAVNAVVRSRIHVPIAAEAEAAVKIPRGIRHSVIRFHPTRSVIAGAENARTRIDEDISAYRINADRAWSYVQ